jgi:hypothetical protein
MSSKLKGDLAPKTNKTPYELRMEILHLAQHIVEEQMGKHFEYLHLKNEMLAEERVVLSQFESDVKTMPNYGVGEVLSIAKELNKFVSNG